MSANEFIELASVQRAIRQRRTFKVLGDPANPIQLDPNSSGKENEQVRQAIADACLAPFHYDRKWEGIAEPFRFHVLWGHECRIVAKNFFTWFPDSKPNNKLPAMLAACGALVMATWIPDTGLEKSKDKSNEVNEEHLAATAAAVQNLLLLLTANGFGTYWSSGGQIRSPLMFEKLEIPAAERLLAAVFVEYSETRSLDLERIGGKHHPNRASASELIREIASVSQAHG